MIENIHTKRLLLRKMRTSDSSSLLKIWSDPEVTKFMNISPFNEESQVVQMIEHLDLLAKEQKAIRFSIIDLNTSEIIGSCGYNSLDYDNDKTEIGYDLAKQHWGKGFAPEAISALVEYAFQSLYFNRVEAKVA